MVQVTCKERSNKWVHTYAAGGAVWAAIPIPVPGLTSAGLAAAEAHMIYWIARIYGERLSPSDIMALIGGLEVAGIGLKALALEAANFIPVVGWWLAKPVIAASAVEGIGFVIVNHFEDKYPGLMYTVSPDVEASATKK